MEDEEKWWSYQLPPLRQWRNHEEQQSGKSFPRMQIEAWLQWLKIESCKQMEKKTSAKKLHLPSFNCFRLAFSYSQNLRTWHIAQRCGCTISVPVKVKLDWLLSRCSSCNLEFQTAPTITTTLPLTFFPTSLIASYVGFRFLVICLCYTCKLLFLLHFIQV